MRFSILAGGLVLCGLAAAPSLAQRHYDTGVTDTEIKIGQTAPLFTRFRSRGETILRYVL